MTWEEIKMARAQEISRRTPLPRISIGQHIAGVGDDGWFYIGAVEFTEEEAAYMTTWLASLFPDAARKGIGEDVNPEAARHNPEPIPHDQIRLDVKMLGEYVAHHPTSCGCVSCLVLRLITEACNQMQGG